MKTEGKIMKKILFATTALVATASVAAADVTFSGMGRFGVKYSGSVAGKAAVAGALSSAEIADTDIVAALKDGGIVEVITSVDTATYNAAAVTAAEVETVQAALAALKLDRAAEVAIGGVTTTIDGQIADVEEALAAMSGTQAVAAVAADTLVTSRLDVNIDASAEAESGVTFGVRVRIRSDEGGTGGINAARFYAKSGGLQLGVGNIYGVIDSMAGLYSGSVGLTGLSYANVVSNFAAFGYSGSGAGSAGTKEAAEIMYSMGDYGFHVATDGTDTEYGVSATMSGWTVALSASDTDTAANSEWVATVGGSIGGVKVGLATAEAVSGDSSTTLSASFDVAAATSVTVYYNDDEANTIEDKSYGLGFSHGLGGGTSLIGGIVSVNDRTMADFGVKFNF